MPEARTPADAVQQKLREVLSKFQSKVSGRSAPTGGREPPGAPEAPAAERSPDARADFEVAEGALGTDTMAERIPQRPSPTRLDLITDAPPEAVRLISAVMLRGGTPSDLITVLGQAGFTIRRNEQAPTLV